MLLKQIKNRSSHYFCHRCILASPVFIQLVHLSVKWIVIILLFFSTLGIQAGETNSSIKSNKVFLEAGGHGGYWSVGYERSFYKFKYGKLNVRAGLSGRNAYDFKQRLNPDFIFPLSFTSQFGVKNHFLEIGVNRTMTSLNFFSPKDHQIKRMLSYSSGFYAGYQYESQEKPFSFRVFYSPTSDFYSILNHWGGMAVGYAF